MGPESTSDFVFYMKISIRPPLSEIEPVFPGADMRRNGNEQNCNDWPRTVMNERCLLVAFAPDGATGNDDDDDDDGLNGHPY